MSIEARKGRDLLGMPVYSIQEGKRLGEVTALLVAAANSTVGAIGFAGAGRTHHLAYERLRVVGADAILIDSEAVLQYELNADEARRLDTGLSGRPVLTISGQRLGTILGFLVETGTGRIEAYRVRPEKGMMARLAASVLDRGLEIPVALVQSLGADALIVSDEAAVGGHAIEEEAQPRT